MPRDNKLTVEYWPLKKVKPYPGNPRKRKKSAVQKVASSIQEFGFRQPIVVDEKGIILVGHTRREAALFLELAEVPVHQALGLSDAQKRAYRIADNRTNEETEWDLDLLDVEIKALSGVNYNLDLTGFEMREVASYLRGGAVEGEDDVEEQDGFVVSQSGDMWQLGPHRIICGDSTNAADVARLFGGMPGKPRLMVTDPPYGVDYHPEWRLERGINKAYQTRAEGLVSNDDRADWSRAWELSPATIAYVWCASLHSVEAAGSLTRCSFALRAQIVWVKTSLVIGRGAYHWQHEPCWYAVRDGSTATWRGDRKQSTVWNVANMHRTQGNVDDGKTDHSTQKPVELMRRPILNHLKKGESVYDPFLGSGSTLIAAESEGRVCFGVEIEPKYVDMIIRRWEKVSGRLAALADGDYAGVTFESAREGRLRGAGDVIMEEALEEQERAAS